MSFYVLKLGMSWSDHWLRSNWPISDPRTQIWGDYKIYNYLSSLQFHSVKKEKTKKKSVTQFYSQLILVYLLLSRVMRNIRWIMWLTLSCSHNSCRDRNDRLISATESSFSSTLSDTEFSDSDWLSPESSTVGEGFKMIIISTETVLKKKMLLDHISFTF